MFPSVWSSLLMVNKQALGTFVSLLMVILRGCTGYRDVTDPRGAGNGGGLGGKARAPPSPRPPRSDQGLISRPPAVPSLFLALEEQEGLEGRRRVHPAVAMAAAAPLPTTSLPPYLWRYPAPQRPRAGGRTRCRQRHQWAQFQRGTGGGSRRRTHTSDPISGVPPADTLAVTSRNGTSRAIGDGTSATSSTSSTMSRDSSGATTARNRPPAEPPVMAPVEPPAAFSPGHQ